MLKILILGATSAMAHETARCFARDGAQFFLVGRNAAKLEGIAQDLTARGSAKVETRVLDLSDYSAHPALLEAVLTAFGGQLDAALLAHGTLGDQAASQASVEVMRRELEVNFLSHASLLTLLANQMEKQRRGVLAVISSVAGERGRASNYVYGTAQGAKTLFTQGLRNRLAKVGVSVITIKPGFVDTPMTADLPKNALYASAAQVGEGIYRAMKAGRNVVYLPFFWAYIMVIIRNIPEAIFKRLNL